MKTRTRIFAVVLTALLLVCSIPTAAFASTYTVTLHCGPEGQGSTYTLTKVAGEPLSLAHTRADVTAKYGLEPKGGSGDQRFFIKWSTSYDPTTSRGNGEDYFDTYNIDADVTLYAIWGYQILYNGDGGIYPETGTSVYEGYVCNYNGSNYNDPKTVYGLHGFPRGTNEPVKPGCRRVRMSNGNEFFALLNADLTIFTTESPAQNLTIPPVGGALPWSVFNCNTTSMGNPAPEFYAIWEPSVTYDPNGGNGQSYSEYLEWGWEKLWKYEYYTIDQNSFTHEGATFKGWNTKPDGSGRSYVAGRRINYTPTRDSDPFTLYAQWETSCQHSYETVTTEPTCGNNGLKVHTCTICGYSYSETVSATGNHSYEAVTTDPTCAADGSTVYTCSVCGDSYSDTIPATGNHSYEAVTTDPTCAADGTTVYTCSVCGDSYSDTIPATGEHTYGEWYVSLEPTYFETGTTRRDCSVCEAFEAKDIPEKEYVNAFEDVADSHWFADEVAYCVKKGYMKGMSETVFSPNTVLTREQFVLILANMAGVNTDDYKDMDSGMSDVQTGAWFSGAVYWAVNEGYVQGVAEGVFGRGQSITRSQLARLLYLYAEKQGNDMTVEGDPFEAFADTAKIQSWAYDNLKWAVSKGIITGVKADELSPNTTATRAQTARMLMIFDTLY